MPSAHFPHILCLYPRPTYGKRTFRSLWTRILVFISSVFHSPLVLLSAVISIHVHIGKDMKQTDKSEQAQQRPAYVHLNLHPQTQHLSPFLELYTYLFFLCFHITFLKIALSKCKWPGPFFSWPSIFPRIVGASEAFLQTARPNPSERIKSPLPVCWALESNFLRIRKQLRKARRGCLKTSLTPWGY